MSQMPDQDAIDDNEKGRLTSAQAMSMIPMILLGVPFFLIGAFEAYGMIKAFVGRTVNDLMIGIIFNGIFAIVLFGLGFWIGGTRIIDIIRGEVRHIDGDGIRFTSRGTSNSGGINFYYGIGAMNFQISSRKTLHILPEYVPVRGYYTPLSKSLVNVKRL